MSQTLASWVNTDVRKVKDKPTQWLSQYYFFRDPARGTFIDSTRFFAPADGIIIYQSIVEPGESIVEIKGKPYSLQDAMRDPDYDVPSLVIGTFMTFFDVHVNRMPTSGRISYEELEPVESYNKPMLNIENGLIQDLRLDIDEADYLHNNQRMVNEVYCPALDIDYYILQIADYDVDCITPFRLAQNAPRTQGSRFSAIRYGSQVDLIIPLDERYEFEPVQKVGRHVEAGIDPLVVVKSKANQDA